MAALISQLLGRALDQPIWNYFSSHTKYTKSHLAHFIISLYLYPWYMNNLNYCFCITVVGSTVFLLKQTTKFAVFLPPGCVCEPTKASGHSWYVKDKSTPRSQTCENLSTIIGRRSCEITMKEKTPLSHEVFFFFSYAWFRDLKFEVWGLEIKFVENYFFLENYVT